MDLLQGTLDMLVLRTLIIAPLHGYRVAKAIRNNSGETLDIEFGSLYPALKRLELKGWIAAKWEISEYNRRVKLLSVDAGRTQTTSTRTLGMGGLRVRGRTDYGSGPGGA